MESSNFPYVAEDFLLAQDTSQPPNSPAVYLSTPSEYQFPSLFLTQNQQHFSQLPETSALLFSQPFHQPFMGLQQSIQLDAIAQPVVSSQDPSFLLSRHSNVHQHNVANYPHTPLVYHTPLADTSVDDSFLATGVELSSTMINPYARASVPFSTTEPFREPPSSSSGSSPSTHATPSQDFESDSAYVSPHAASNFESAPGGVFGYPSNAEHHLTHSILLPSYVDPAMAHRSTDASNYLDRQPPQAPVPDDEGSLSAACPNSVITPMNVSDYLDDTNYYSPAEASVPRSPTPVFSPGCASQKLKRKELRQDDDQRVAKRRKTQSKTRDDVGDEKFKAAMERKGATTLQCPDPDCKSKPFASQQELDRHGKKKHGRYPCIFSFVSDSGCDKRFSKKNEWKRHCTTQHIVPEYYVCPQADCQERRGNDKVGNFLRKDLFEAHFDRCHTPAHVKDEHSARKAENKILRDNLRRSGAKTKRRSAAAQRNADDDDDESLTGIPFSKIPCSSDYRNSCQERQEFTKRGLRYRVKLPSSIVCDFQGCGTVFEGDEALNKYLEHVAKYIDGVTPSADDFQFGLTLIPYFTAIGILEAKDGTPGNHTEWKLISEVSKMIVSPEYLPDYDPDAY